MIRRILVPTDGSETAAIGMRYAVAFAKKCDATLCGLHVVDVKLLEGPFLRDLSASLGTAPYVNYQGNIALILEERGRAALAAFEELCGQHGVACETALVTGVVAREVVEQSSLADLIIMGRSGEHSAWLEGLLGSTTDAVVRRSRQPVLVTGSDTLGDRRLLAAYDGSPHADNALKLAANLAENWNASLRVLVVAEDRDQERLDRARNYLQAHRIEAEWRQCSGDPRDAIVAQTQEFAADILLMGAFGHSKVRELVLGSTTSHVLSHSPCPVMLTR